MTRVFVYGTLRPGQRNHHYMATATHCGAYTTPACFTLLDTGPYPAALDEGDTALVGDVFEVDDDTFAALDVLEGEPPDPASPIFDAPNIILTPHMAGSTNECLDTIARTAAADIARVLDRKRAKFPVNRPVKRR